MYPKSSTLSGDYSVPHAQLGAGYANLRYNVQIMDDFKYSDFSKLESKTDNVMFTESIAQHASPLKYIVHSHSEMKLLLLFLTFS